MPYIRRDGEVEIRRHSKGHYCGQNGKIFDVREELGPNASPVTDSVPLLQPAIRLRKDVQIGCPPQEFFVHDWEQEWLELYSRGIRN